MVNVARRFEEVEFVVSPTPGKHPVIRGVYSKYGDDSG